MRSSLFFAYNTEAVDSTAFELTSSADLCHGLDSIWLFWSVGVAASRQRIIGFHSSFFFSLLFSSFSLCNIDCCFIAIKFVTNKIHNVFLSVDRLREQFVSWEKNGGAAIMVAPPSKICLRSCQVLDVAWLWWVPLLDLVVWSRRWRAWWCPRRLRLHSCK